MTEENNNDRSSSAPPARAPLSLKPRTSGAVSAGVVKQSFSHGRSKTVVVETKRRRIDAPAGHGAGPSLGGPSAAERRAAFDVRGPATPARPAAPSTGAATGGLSEDERRARQRVIEAAQAQQAKLDAEREAARARAEAARRREAEERAAAAAASAAEEAAKAPAETPSAGAEEPASEVRAAPQRPAAAPRPTEPPAPRPAARPSEPARPGFVQTRTYEPGRERRDDRISTTTYRPERQGGDTGFGQRPAARGPSRGPAPAGGRSERSPRPGETVRYSAVAPRTPREGRPGPRGPSLGRAAPPPTPEIQRATRQAPRPGSLDLDRRPDFDDEEAARKGKTAPGKAVSRTRGEPRRREGRLTIQAVAGDDEDAVERMRSLASVRRAREREREKRRGGGQSEQRAAREVVIPDVITVQELAGRMTTRSVEVVKFLARQGMMLKPADVIDSDTAELVATEFGHTVRRVSESDVETGFLTAEGAADEGAVERPPVVTVMGHVDHGKTSLLDALRSTDVVSKEHGGITQHIGAYQTRLPSGESVTFLDTPGHAAFSAMRARGANVTDIVVLVVAADDGVMPQTIEAIQHAKAAGAPIIVAINKVDKADADPNRVINELLQHEIVVESLGGDTQAVQVSAVQKTGLDDLLEAILLQAQVMDLKANPDRNAEGVVVESKVDRGRGAVATVLVKRGTLRRGDIVVAGANFGRVRALLNERGEQVADAGPSEPVEILGLDGTPDPGEPFAAVENEARARELTEYRTRMKRERTQAPVAGASLADMMAKFADNRVTELPLVIKADVQGSAEAIVGAINNLGTAEVRARMILSGAGGVNESDVMLAKGAGAPILGFNVRASKQARDLAEREGVEIRYYAIIYDLIDDIRGVLSGLLAPVQRENFLGNAEVLQVFDISKVGKVAGCRVTEGVVRKGARVRIVRQDVVVLELGTLQTLKRFKDEVNEVQTGQECGMAFQGFQDIKAGDLIECFTVEEVKRTL
ncbi:MAG TPA: translation initiation factor IF-2 [Caulobacteraceae bacterium]|nr:translation initiation factor IF-2 [Caulobacteraceae bacterium]